jgi:hypothetical protein
MGWRGAFPAGARVTAVTDNVHQLLRDQYHLVAKDIVGPLVDVLTTARAVFAGDLDKCLILLVIALRTTQAGPIRDIRLEEVLRGEVAEYPSLYTNVRSVADSTGVPRETVRRKVAALVEAGWVTRKGDDLALTPLASQHLTPMREALFDQAIRLHALIERARTY